MSTVRSSAGGTPESVGVPASGSVRGPMDRTAYVLGIAAMIATFVPPGLFAAPVLGLLAVVLGVAALIQARAAGRPYDQALIGLVLGGTALVLSGTLLWMFRHVIASALHDALVASG